MALEPRDQRPFEKAADLENFVAELAVAVYPVALRHKADAEWLDLQLELWQTLAQTVKTWYERQSLPHSK